MQSKAITFNLAYLKINITIANPNRKIAARFQKSNLKFIKRRYGINVSRLLFIIIYTYVTARLLKHSSATFQHISE